mmetsp:Transcript_88339/g.230608  ORF Transcript_88339/g.230608 Transcript_88339/m.230608 type:complete len:245 (+) Transcript_88339:169-903(+)
MLLSLQQLRFLIHAGVKDEAFIQQCRDPTEAAKARDEDVGTSHAEQRLPWVVVHNEVHITRDDLTTSRRYLQGAQRMVQRLRIVTRLILEGEARHPAALHRAPQCSAGAAHCLREDMQEQLPRASAVQFQGRGQAAEPLRNAPSAELLWQVVSGRLAHVATPHVHGNVHGTRRPEAATRLPAALHLGISRGEGACAREEAGQDLRRAPLFDQRGLSSVKLPCSISRHSIVPAKVHAVESFDGGS